MRQLVGHHGLILLVGLIVLFANLGGARLWDQDEPRNAGCALEMMQRGDWVVPIFNNQLRDAKPVLLYWLIMSAYWVFGVNEFAARFWSAMLAVGTVLATYHIGRRLFNTQAALWSAIILATSLMFDVAGRAATPDSVLIFCGTMALLVFVLGAFQPNGSSHDVVAPRLRQMDHFFPQHWPVVSAMYSLMGLGLLAKGPVGLVLPTAVIGMFLLVVRLPKPSGDTPAEPPEPSLRTGAWTAGQMAQIVLAVSLFILIATSWGWAGLAASLLAAGLCLSIVGQRGWLCVLKPFAPWHFLQTCWVMRPVTALVVALAVALPWYVWVGVRTEGAFVSGFFWKEHLGRATTAMENHDGSLLFYPAAILFGFFPWSVFMAPMVIDLFQRIRRRDPWSIGYLLVSCWVGVYVAIFTLAETKLPSYVTPCYPGLALLAGCFIYHWSRGTSLAAPFWPVVSLATLATVGLLMIVALGIAAHQYLPGSEWLAAMGLIPLCGSFIGLWLIRNGQVPAAANALAVAAVLLATGIFGVATQHVDRHQQSHLVLKAIASQAGQPEVAYFGNLEPSWVFYSGHSIRGLTLEANANSPQARARNWHPPPPLNVHTLFAHNEAFVITTSRHLPLLKPQLPDDVKVLAEAQYFLKKDQLLLLGRPSTTIRSASGRRGARASR